MKHLRPALAFTAFFILLGGLAFPGVIYVLAQVIFPRQANGSLIRDGAGHVVGSSLIAQSFTKPGYFHPRPSAAGNGYDAGNSGGTNLGPTSAKLFQGVHGSKDPSDDFDGVQDLARAYRVENGLEPNAPIPPDAVTRSASGLDPDISLENANLQAHRVAKARSVSLDRINSLLSASTERTPGDLFGSARVNVLQLNLALDKEFGHS